jgi:predicted nuclease of predicted toxin-antitoxin system
MVIWIDAQLSPVIAEFVSAEFHVPSIALRDLGLRDATDEIIFTEAKRVNAIVMTKDEDFSILLSRYGPPPKIIWITCGNTSNEHLMTILRRVLKSALSLLESEAEIVEIS